MPSSAPSHARKTKVVKSANASALAASKASKAPKAQRLRRAGPLQPFKQQRVLRIIKECIKEATAEGGELHALLLTLKEGASLKMRKAAGVAMFSYLCDEYLRLSVDAQVLAHHAKRLTVMSSDWQVLRRVKQLKD
jgi:histone H3/H4